MRVQLVECFSLILYYIHSATQYSVAKDYDIFLIYVTCSTVTCNIKVNVTLFVSMAFHCRSLAFYPLQIILCSCSCSSLAKLVYCLHSFNVMHNMMRMYHKNILSKVKKQKNQTHINRQIKKLIRNPELQRPHVHSFYIVFFPLWCVRFYFWFKIHNGEILPNKKTNVRIKRMGNA